MIHLSAMDSLATWHGSWCSSRRSSRLQIVAVVKRSPKRLKYAGMSSGRPRELQYLKFDPYGSNFWAIEQVVTLLKTGAVGVIPTDTLYTIVCALQNRSAIYRLYRIKDINPKKPLSLLCRSFQDIDRYTSGFPRERFRIARQCLPGPYTFILPASKLMPKQCTNFGGKIKASYAPRRSVGVRIPGDPIWYELAQQLDEPLICTSVRVPDNEEWLLDPEAIAETYGPSSGRESLDFIVDGGVRVAEPSTIVDMTRVTPVVLRKGKVTSSLDLFVVQDLSVSQGPVEDWMYGDTDSTLINPYSE